jgi:hypothetical protein
MLRRDFDMKKLFFSFNLLLVLLVFTFTANATRYSGYLDNEKSFPGSVKRAYENTDKLHEKSTENDRRSSHKIYTIQTGSFIDIERAHKKFESLMRGLKKYESDHLRIEKIGKYYVVRIGKFEDYSSIKKALKAVKSRIPKAIILKAYLKKERVKRINNGKNKKIKWKRNKVMETRAYTNQLQIDFSETVNILGGDITVENKSSEDAFEIMSVLASGPDITVTDSFGNTGVYSVTKFYLSLLDYNLDDIIADTLPAILKSDWFTPFSGLIYDYKSSTKVQDDYHQDYDQVGGPKIIQFAHFVPEISIMLVLGSVLLGIGFVYLCCKLEAHFNRGREL